MSSNKNKVIYNGEVLVDLTNDSVTPENLKEGVTAHDASGKQITGTRTEPKFILTDGVLFIK